MTRAMRCATARLAPLVIVATIHSQQPAQPGGAVNRTLTAIPGIKVGHFTLSERPTGCTVVLIDGDAVGGVSQRGGAPVSPVATLCLGGVPPRLCVKRSFQCQRLSACCPS